MTPFRTFAMAALMVSAAAASARYVPESKMFPLETLIQLCLRRERKWRPAEHLLGR